MRKQYAKAACESSMRNEYPLRSLHREYCLRTACEGYRASSTLYAENAKVPSMQRTLLSTLYAEDLTVFSALTSSYQLSKASYNTQ